MGKKNKLFLSSVAELLGDSQAISNLVTQRKLWPKPCESVFFQAPVFSQCLIYPVSMDVVFHSHEVAKKNLP